MVVTTLAAEFRKVKALADAAIAQLDDAQLNARLDAEANSVAMLVQHLAGNMRSRWTDFLSSDGEKPWRHRDQEFDPPGVGRADLMARWEAGWATLFTALDGLSDADLDRRVVIRGESPTVLAAIALTTPDTCTRSCCWPSICAGRRGASCRSRGASPRPTPIASKPPGRRLPDRRPSPWYHRGDGRVHTDGAVAAVAQQRRGEPRRAAPG
jgi:hypothetical protein